MPASGRPLEKSLYVAGWPRIVDVGSGNPNPNHSGACAHDGECRDSGCGYACLSTRDRQFLEFACIALPAEDRRLRDHYCGCVDGTCSWFTQ
jgi:hypothetical protein